MQRMAGVYIANRIKKELFPSPDEVEDDTAEVAAHADELDGQVVHDDDGNAIGRAHRLSDVAVYVVTDQERPADALLRALRDPDCQILFQTASGRATAVIYIPEPLRESPRPSVRGIRADDV